MTKKEEKDVSKINGTSSGTADENSNPGDASVITIVDSVETTPAYVVPTSTNPSVEPAQHKTLNNSNSIDNMNSSLKSFSNSISALENGASGHQSISNSSVPPKIVRDGSVLSHIPTQIPHKTDSGENKRVGSLTKLPLPPGINLEDINSPTSSPEDKVQKQRFSITKDLPMPPGKSHHYFLSKLFHIFKLLPSSYYCITGRANVIFCAVGLR